MNFGIQLGYSQPQNNLNTSSFQEIQNKAPPEIKQFEPQLELNQYQEQVHSYNYIIAFSQKLVILKQKILYFKSIIAHSDKINNNSDNILVLLHYFFYTQCLSQLKHKSFRTSVYCPDYTHQVFILLSCSYCLDYIYNCTILGAFCYIMCLYFYGKRVRYNGILHYDVAIYLQFFLGDSCLTLYLSRKIGHLIQKGFGNIRNGSFFLQFNNVGGRG
ncbi:unnamed protein product (macronuclear) [Paramecium tetraurelia]|uniref:Transmembrane protein n=1 Tax=Paramecium tetraurelia TaxID=5888 RepID=A0DR56_PARTE|nr:uncharacterized protein GSPATT00002924001 [Paramecium tetraurelia]CAK85523.1 unnamed protein product [Paramecium tetraurelia]|eukprot:XP_001452920.1 hypothetical protein (macronuclear) [Paramecium tetraurelia strain d4-2]